MRVTKVPEGGAKKKLLDAAETLVAGNGFDSVSVRDVTGAAGANVAAVNYHFGSREGLMDLVIARILEPLCADRIKALEGAGKSPAPKALVRAYLSALPKTAEGIAMEGAMFQRLAGRILALPDEAMPPVLATARREVSARYLAAIPKAKAADWAFFEAGIAQSLITTADSGKMGALMEDWIEFGLRGLAAAGGGEQRADEAQGLLFDF